MSRRGAASQLAVGGWRESRRLRLPPTAYRLLLVALLFLANGAFAAELPFIEDDYAKAVARAKAKNVPIFVEAWAPW